MNRAVVKEHPGPPPVKPAVIPPAEKLLFAGVTGTVPDEALAPAAFVAVTEHRYVVLFASPETVTGEVAPVPVSPPGLQVAVKPVIGLPFAGPGVKLIVALPLPGAAVPMVGADGTVNGVTATVPEAGPVPAALVAVTEHEYDVPFASPPTAIGDAVFVPVIAPGLQVAVKLVIGLPFEAPGVKAIVAVPLPGVPVPIVGALGAVAGVTETVPDAGPVPTAFVAVTEHVYVVPLASPLTTIGDALFVPVIAPTLHVAV
jgi:hypothetical protein